MHNTSITNARELAARLGLHHAGRDALAAAQALAAEGFPCFPCRGDKAPACPGGFKAATTDQAALPELWNRFPGPLLGVATGTLSGFDVLDLDAKHAEARAWWREKRSDLPITRVHRTRSGGLHLLLRHADGLRCSAGKIAAGIDVRADGGFIVWWPSAGLPVVPGGAIAPWPVWLLGKLQTPPAATGAAARPRSPTLQEGAHLRRYAVAALRRAIERVASAPEGQRNNTLNAETFGLARFLAEGALSPYEVAEGMAHAALASGLPPLEAQRTIASALDAGAAA